MNNTIYKPPHRILVIRRDNIGDLVCTTPLFTTLRDHFPHTHIAALVNSYNSPVLNNNPNIDAVYVYKKAKHRNDGESKISVWLSTLRLIANLRRQKWDYAIIATTAYSKSALKFARGVKAHRIIAFAPKGTRISDPIDPRLTDSLHETESVFQLLAPFGIHSKPGPVELFNSSPLLFSSITAFNNAHPIVGLHISARKPNQRWSIEKFSKLAHEIHNRYKSNFFLFWSPGPMEHSQHPGDDEKAEKMQSLCNDIPLTLFPTKSLTELITGLSVCDYIICSDGGGMHLAAGLGKPIICLFGNSSAAHWHPWGVPYELLQKESEMVEDISVKEVLSANSSLLKKTNIHKT